MPTIHLLIKGKVQGVFYRASAKDVAEEIGITGWIRNTSEGNVEVLANGSDEQLQLFITWCKKGTSKSVVTDIAITQKADEPFDCFRIIK